MLHDGHPGSTRMKMLARSYVYWTRITKDIEDYVHRCQSCQEAAKEPIKTTLFTWPVETKPWSRVHIDFAGPFHGRMFLIVVDAYSKWPEVMEVSTTTTKATIRQLSKLFAQFGNPEVLVSDNGSQFTSREFAEFCQVNGVEHVRLPPYHPQSNGQPESSVDTFKRTIRKLKGSDSLADALQKFLAVYRRTPCPASPHGRSPAENFLQREVRSPLSQLTTPRTRNTTRNRAMEEQFNHHHGARSRAFAIGDMVWAREYQRNRRKWSSSRIAARHGHAVYDVQLNGTIERRHTNQLRPASPEDKISSHDNFDDLLYDGSTATAPTPPGRTAKQQSSMEEPDATMDRTTPNEQRPQRNRRAPDRLQIDPSLKSYV